MLAKIHLKQIKISTIIGARIKERSERQPLIIDASFEIDIKKAVQTDQMEDTVDYSEIAKEIIAVSESTKFNLLESFAAHIAQTILEKFSLKSISLIVHKPHATKGVSEVSIEYFLQP